MKLYDLKRIAAARTKGPWKCAFMHHKECEKYKMFMKYGDIHTDMEFITTAANTYDALLDIAEAAKKILEYRIRANVDTPILELMEALKRLEEL